MQKRGQFTVFVIVGIVLLIAFGFAIYARNVLVMDSLEAKANDLVRDTVQSSALNTYVNSCVQEILEDGLDKMALQGGLLYTEQNGTVQLGGEPGITYIPYIWNESLEPVKVPYGLIPNTACGLVQPDPPAYPKSQTFLHDLEGVYFNSLCGYRDPGSGFFGQNTLTKLCSYNGSNRLNASQSITQYRTCAIGTYNQPPAEGQVPAPTIQSQLEDYIVNQLPSCVNLSTFLQHYNANITVLGDPDAEVTFGEHGFTVHARYPLQAAMDGVPVTVTHDFSSDWDWDLKNLYNFIYFLLAQDAFYAKFSIQESYTSNLYYRPSYQVQVQRNILYDCADCTEGKYDDMLLVQDDSININGKPLVFQIAIKNRRPALDWLPNPRQVASGVVDILAVENKTIELWPEGVDPDDAPIWFNYSGWKETTDDRFDMARALNGNCNDAYFQDCMTTIQDEPHAWTNSALFALSGKDAKYQTNHTDIGFHEVNISVWDESGLIDYQLVHILIFDLPQAVIQGSNPYADVDDGYASIEDPYYLNGSKSRASLLGGHDPDDLAAFLWNDTTEPFTERTTEPFLWVSSPPSEADIISLTDQPFSVLGNHELLLEVVENLQGTDFTSLPDRMDVEVKACVPHRDDSPSYPYNDPGTDAFQANHTCCMDDFTLRETGTCFSEVTYGSLFAIQDELGTYALDSPLEDETRVIWPQGAATSQAVPGTLQNDIFKRTFTRSCSGGRGNICSGPAQDLITLQTSCPDNILPEGERCTGPPVATLTRPGQSAPYCVNYPAGSTFEGIFLGGTGDCGQPRPSTATNYNVPSGPFLCVGLCDGRGGCTIPADCTCNLDTACDGLTPEELPKTLDTCNQAGESYFLDSCTTSCTAQDDSRICRSAAGGIGCTASPSCDGIAAGACIPGTGYRCTTSCAYQPDPDCTA